MASSEMKQLLVLAGGFGKRLRSVVSSVPKPLAPVNGEPFLKHLMINWQKQGIREMTLLLHYEAEKIVEIAQELQSSASLKGTKVTCITESTPLGTGGALLNAVQILDLKESFLVANADTWLESSILPMARSHPCSIGTVEVPDASRYGEVVLREGYVSEFKEKTGFSNPGRINAGIYHLHPEIFMEVEKQKSFSLETDLFPNLVATSCLRGVELRGYFMDIGIPSDYFQFCESLNV